MLRNYEDTKCKWGFITLCDTCVEAVKWTGPNYLRHVNTEVEVKDMPLHHTCEICKEKK